MKLLIRVLFVGPLREIFKNNGVFMKAEIRKEKCTRRISSVSKVIGVS